MDLKEVHRVLHDIFQKELTNGRKRHIVFWYDEEGEFIEDIDNIHLDHVRIWKFNQNNLFATKYELEKKDTTSHFLLYANMPKPVPREDWLYDLQKIGYEFATDKITVIMRELGIHDDGLRETFKSYKTFFNRRSRFQAFRRYPMEVVTEENIDLTVLASLTKSPTNNLDDIVKSLFGNLVNGEDKVLEEIEKYGNEERFWALVEKYFGYTLPEKNIQSLLIFFILTYLEQQSPIIEFPKVWKNYISERPTNIIVLMDQWMNHREERKLYNQLANQISETIRVEDYANKWDINELTNLDAFRYFDEKIIQFLVEQLTNNLTHFDYYMDIILQRRTCHWFKEFEHEYNAIYHAVELLQQMQEIDYFIPEQSSYQMFQEYTKNYYKIDTAYRKFYVAFDQQEEKERLYPLQEKIENIYTNSFIEELAMKWMASIFSDDQKGWPIPSVPLQKEFYRNWVYPYQVNDERVFVIISDALRYEVAVELMNVLNNQRKATTEINAMQSVVPSYTALGMASLLPHKKLEMTFNGQVFADGVNTSGTKNRNEIIQNNISDALAISFNDVMKLNRDAMREAFHGKKLVYIYHNSIDARGDNAATEIEVFQAAEESINDLRLLVNQLVNNVSASNIIITADHGFIYQRNPLRNSQKLPNRLEDTILTKRRFSLSNQRENTEGTITFSMDYLLDQEERLFVTVPKGINRFSIQGVGANYVHGGAMLQEIVLPVITFKNDRSKSSANAVHKVDVKLTTPSRKITNTITFLEFFQTDKVEEKKIPLRLKLYFVDEEGNRISNENIIIADSSSTRATERTYKEKFVFKSQRYDKRKTYYLILEDEKNENIYERYPFTIDIAFSDEF